MDSNSLPLSNLSPAQRKAFNGHLNDLWDDYQDELADLIIEAKTMVPNSLYFGDDPTTEARRQLEDYARKANLIAQDYYRNVRGAWAEAAGISMPDYKEAQVSSDRAFWQIVGGYNNTMHVGAKFTDVINGRSKAGLTMDHLWAINTRGYTEDDWARLAKDVINETARLTGRFTAQNDPTRPKYARVPQGRTCAFCAMLASRGFVYASEDTAGKWHRYHHDCDCKIVPSWGETKLDGYEPDKFKRMYKAAKSRAGTSETNAVMKAMNHMFPDELTSGVFESSAEWPAEVIQPRAKTWDHVFANHGPDATVPGKTHFPKEWDEKKIKWAVEETVVAPDLVIPGGRERQTLYKIVEDEIIRVWLQKTRNTGGRFTVHTAHPVVPQQKEKLWQQIRNAKPHTGG